MTGIIVELGNKLVKCKCGNWARYVTKTWYSEFDGKEHKKFEREVYFCEYCGAIIYKPLNKTEYIT